MDTNGEGSGNARGSLTRKLVSWPIVLLGLTVAGLLVANTVSAWGRHGGHDIDDMKEHVQHVLDRVFDRLDATEEQAAAIEAIVLNTVDELHANRAEREDSREAFRELVTAESIDRDALEAMRLSHLDHADEMSRLIAERAADVLEILTPEQRRQLEEHLSSRHGHGPGRFFGRGRLP